MALLIGLGLISLLHIVLLIAKEVLLRLREYASDQLVGSDDTDKFEFYSNILGLPLIVIDQSKHGKKGKGKPRQKIRFNQEVRTLFNYEATVHELRVADLNKEAQGPPDGDIEMQSDPNQSNFSLMRLAGENQNS